MNHRNIILLGGWSLLLFTFIFLGTNIVIDILSAKQAGLYSLKNYGLFDVKLGTPLIHFFLTIYSISPLLLIPGIFSSNYYLHEREYRPLVNLASCLGLMGAFSLTLSTMLLPSANWILVSFIQQIPRQHQMVLIEVLNAFHNYFGIFIGDILGFGLLIIWCIVTSIRMLFSMKNTVKIAFIELAIALLMIILLINRCLDANSDWLSLIKLPAVISLWAFIFGILHILSVFQQEI